MSTDGYLLFDPASKVARTIVVFGDNNQLVSMSIPELLKYYDDAVFLPCFIKVNPAKDESAWYQPGAAEAEGFPSTGFVRLSSAAAASGSYVLETKCADVWGNSTSVDDNVTVP
jgi:hypothetical protein